MLQRHISQIESALSIRLRQFGLALKASPLFLSGHDQLIFLCGANVKQDHPSARRGAIKKFIEGISTRYKVVYAEPVFNELARLGSSRKNLLDLEEEISRIADKIIIVLESPGSFCELGAFALHDATKDKLIVINDSKFRMQASFINDGPVAALTEIKRPVFWYPMSEFGLRRADGIGAVFNELRKSIYAGPRPGRELIKDDLAELLANKNSLYFVHDLILFTGPVTHQELVDVLSSLFGTRPFDRLRRLIGILRSADLIDVREYRPGAWAYASKRAEPYLEYEPIVRALTATFRVFHLKYNRERFSHV